MVLMDSHCVLRPIGMTIHSYNSNSVLTAVKCMWSGCIQVWKKLLVMLMVTQIFPLAQSVRISLICGIGCESVTMFSFS